MNEASYYNNSIFYLSPIVRSRAFVTFFDPQAPNRWNIATLLVYTSLVLAVIVCLVLVKKYVKRHLFLFLSFSFLLFRKPHKVKICHDSAIVLDKAPRGPLSGGARAPPTPGCPSSSGSSATYAILYRTVYSTHAVPHTSIFNNNSKEFRLLARFLALCLQSRNPKGRVRGSVHLRAAGFALA